MNPLASCGSGITRVAARAGAGAADSATLVRGTDAYGNFEHEPRPAADCDAAALAAHAAVTDRQQKVLYRGTGIGQYRS